MFMTTELYLTLGLMGVLATLALVGHWAQRSTRLMARLSAIADRAADTTPAFVDALLLDALSRSEAELRRLVMRTEGTLDDALLDAASPAVRRFVERVLHGAAPAA